MGQSPSTPVQHCEMVLKFAKGQGNKQQEAKANLDLGNAYKSILMDQKAIAHFNEALKIATERKDKEQEKEAYLRLVDAHISIKQLKQAFEYIEKILQSRKEEHRIEKLSTEDSTKTSSTILGAHDDSKKNLHTSNTSDDIQLQDAQHKTVDNAEQIGLNIDIQGIKTGDDTEDDNKVNYNQKLGEVFLLYDFNNKKAIKYYKKAREVSPGFEAVELEVEAYERLGYNHFLVGQYKESLECYEEVIKLTSQLGNKKQELNAYLALGIAFRNTGDFESSEKYFLKAREMTEQLNDKSLQLEAVMKLGHVYYVNGKFDAALTFYLKAQEIFLIVGLHLNLERHLFMCDYHWSHHGYSCDCDWKRKRSVLIEHHFWLHCQMSHYPDGKRRLMWNHYWLRHEICRNIDNRKYETNICFMLGNIFQELKQEEKAIEYYQRAINISKGLKDEETQMIAKQRLGISCLTLASVCSKDRDYETAVRWYEKALDVFGTRRNNRLLREKALTGLGVAWFNLGCTEKAIESIQKAQKFAKTKTDTDLDTHEDDNKNLQTSDTSEVVQQQNTRHKNVDNFGMDIENESISEETRITAEQLLIDTSTSDGVELQGIQHECIDTGDHIVIENESVSHETNVSAEQLGSSYRKEGSNKKEKSENVVVIQGQATVSGANEERNSDNALVIQEREPVAATGRGTPRHSLSSQVINEMEQSVGHMHIHVPQDSPSSFEGLDSHDASQRASKIPSSKVLLYNVMR